MSKCQDIYYRTDFPNFIVDPTEFKHSVGYRHQTLLRTLVGILLIKKRTKDRSSVTTRINGVFCDRRRKKEEEKKRTTRERERVDNASYKRCIPRLIPDMIDLMRSTFGICFWKSLTDRIRPHAHDRETLRAPRAQSPVKRQPLHFLYVSHFQAVARCVFFFSKVFLSSDYVSNRIVRRQIISASN